MYVLVPTDVTHQLAFEVCAFEQIKCKAKWKSLFPYLVFAWTAEQPLYKRPQEKMDRLQGISGYYNWW